MDAQDTDINIYLAHVYEYLTKSICSLSADLKQSHRLLDIIKKSTQKEADIGCTIVMVYNCMYLFICAHLESKDVVVPDLGCNPTT